jgi:hypothetical protein
VKCGTGGDALAGQSGLCQVQYWGSRGKKLGPGLSEPPAPPPISRIVRLVVVGLGIVLTIVLAALLVRGHR